MYWNRKHPPLFLIGFSPKIETECVLCRHIKFNACFNQFAARYIVKEHLVLQRSPWNSPLTLVTQTTRSEKWHHFKVHIRIIMKYIYVTDNTLSEAMNPQSYSWFPLRSGAHSQTPLGSLRPLIDPALRNRLLWDIIHSPFIPIPPSTILVGNASSSNPVDRGNFVVSNNGILGVCSESSPLWFWYL